ncbi:MAG: glycosyl transferase, partial [Patescibacteria group bacterium]|nr:glycosyl transferase [Patescibacteria group bacterium]
MKLKLILILLLAAGLRFYQLGRVPSGFVNDEAAFGYNAYSLIKTGRDEFGEFLPIIFHSFGEGK